MRIAMTLEFTEAMQRLKAAALLLLLTVIIAGCGSGNGEVTDMKKLADVEVRDYKGEKLSSITDLRENSIKGPQVVDQASYRLKIEGLVDKPRTYTYRDVIDKHENYSKVVKLDCVEGWDVTILWEGVLVKDLLKEAGVKPNAKIVIFYARDGYSTSFPVNYLLKNDILMAYEMNGVTLPPECGFPFHLVAEEKWGYKWVKWIERIELSDNLNYRGYWESRGYSNEGDLDKEFFSQ
jgi:DMSO/TMAO reductase YedYZ molybdopterin-dependent catalytic subunit